MSFSGGATRLGLCPIVERSPRNCIVRAHLGARNFGEVIFGEVIEAQTRYAQRAYDAYMSQVSKVGEMYLGTTRNATKPIEQASKRLS